MSLLLLCSCNLRSTQSEQPTTEATSPTPSLFPADATPSPQPPRLLTICLGNEPASLFIYADGSAAARAIRQAIYDGPVDIRNYSPEPVILESIPTVSNGDVRFEPLSVAPGNIIEDSSGELVALKEGVVYLPAGCEGINCAVGYTGSDPVQIDQMVVRFRLRPGVLWSDGNPIKADDSVFSYEIARRLYPKVRADLISRTAAYQAVDETTVEWRGVPGYREASYATFYFTPLPRHAWGSLPLEELPSADAVNRAPLGWGPYVIQEWTPGDHISLIKNANYFRADEGLPKFDRLVFRFTPAADAAVDALLAGECDYLDETVGLEPAYERLVALQGEGKIILLTIPAVSWEHLDFGISSIEDPSGSPVEDAFFGQKAVRQAAAQCIDRQRLVDELLPGRAVVAEGYLPPAHPLANPELKPYPYDPQAGAALLTSAGWVDPDGNPATPRVSQGVADVPDGTPFEVSLLTTTEPVRQRVAEFVKGSLAECGLGVNVESKPWQEVFAPGPDGPVFGRHFALAQFGWTAAWQPPCYLYTTAEIPGPYPDFPKGWGGANDSGYSSLEFDQACRGAFTTTPGTPENQAANDKAQEIYNEDVPALPLYWNSDWAVMRPDTCSFTVDPSAESDLWNLEVFDYGAGCGK
jgi:peptide/nickel transport system substrate-binding protein